MTWQTPEGDPPPDPTGPPNDAATSEPTGSPEPPVSPETPVPPAPSPDAPTQPTAGLISAAPVGWSAPEAPAQGTASGPGPGDPLVAWAPPVAPVRVSVAEGLVIAGTFTRLVAYSVDILLLTSLEVIVNGLLGQYNANPNTSLAAIVGIVFVGIDFLYFIGLWTSGWQGTLGMRLLSLRVLGAKDAGTLSLNGALLRWLALTGAIAILSLVPRIGPYVGLLSILWFLALLVTTGADRLHQGLHDRWAGSVVVQPAPGGSGAAFVTCLVLVVFVGGILPVIALALAGDQLRDILSRIGDSV